MTKYFRREGKFDVSTEIDVRPTEEIEEEADKKALKAFKKGREPHLELGENTHLHNLHEEYNPDKDPEYLRLKAEAETRKHVSVATEQAGEKPTPANFAKPTLFNGG